MAQSETMQMKHAKPSRRKLGPVQWMILALCLCVLGFSGWKLQGIFAEYKVGKDTYNEISEFVLTNASVASIESRIEDDDIWPLYESHVGISIPEVDFDALLNISSYSVAWLYCPDTMINYPVGRANNNKYFLDHTLNGRYNSGGCLFLDYRNPRDFSDDNNVIYGHHMNNGTMFNSLENYHHQYYYDAHPVIYMTTEEGKSRLEIFAGYVTPSTSESYLMTFKTREEKQAWLDRCISQSNFTSNIRVTPDDHIVTLSTCVYDYTNARYVVQCKMVECENGIWY